MWKRKILGLAKWPAEYVKWKPSRQAIQEVSGVEDATLAEDWEELLVLTDSDKAEYRKWLASTYSSVTT